MTPGALSSARCTRIWQAAQVIPPTERLTRRVGTVSGDSSRFFLGGCDRVLSGLAMTVFMSVSLFLLHDVNWVSCDFIIQIFKNTAASVRLSPAVIMNEAKDLAQPGYLHPGIDPSPGLRMTMKLGR